MHIYNLQYICVCVYVYLLAFAMLSQLATTLDYKLINNDFNVLQSNAIRCTFYGLLKMYLTVSF